MAVSNGTAIPVGTTGLLAMGADAGGTARRVLTDNTGALVTTSGGDADQVTFSAIATSIAVASNKSMLSILNADATKLVYVYQIYIVNAQTAAATGVIGNFELRRITSHSAGTLITPLPLETTDVIDADITVRTGGTVGGESASLLNRWLWSTDEFGAGTADVESADHALQNLFPAFQRTQKTKPIVLGQNEGLTVKFATASTAGSFDIKILFTQV